jgi:hypothetical protein
MWFLHQSLPRPAAVGNASRLAAAQKKIPAEAGISLPQD